MSVPPDNPPTPYGAPGGAPSKAMAGWALGLSLVFCVPFLAAIVAVVLAVIVLQRSRDGRDHGRGLAVAALVVAGLVLVLQSAALVIGLLGGFDTDDSVRDESGEVIETGELSTFDMADGDCFDDPALTGAADDEEIEAETVEAIPCDEPHELEVYHIFEATDEEFPGVDALAEQAQAGCAAEFKGFTGVRYDKSALDLYFYYPLESSWDLVGDRAIVCALDDPDETTTGSLEGAAR